MSSAEADDVLERTRTRIVKCWRQAREAFSAHVIHQTPLPVHPALLGGNDHRLPGSPAAFLQRLAYELRGMADQEGVDLLALDQKAARDGLDAWSSAALWRRSKQEISPSAAPLYGDLVARVIAAKHGRSSKGLVLDLDNTLWGGVIGDDGLQGIVLGQGNALGEGFAAFQHYARELARRGVILAVCSKNDEANAVEPFNVHPEMVLKRSDIASFVASWDDKSAGLKRVAAELNIGLDSLVFVDDNPFERALVRRELPMVEVPELPEDPSLFCPRSRRRRLFRKLGRHRRRPRARSEQYQENRKRESLRESSTDLEGYLRSLGMSLRWRRFDRLGLARITQLINKTNQFNLTTRRYNG